ncbi:hypothetical protein [Deinococcus sp.]|uniref:hypothetical protein n=1 Tax=Deinococcus sp. TaxID=47478 RepID=UPI003B5A2566
MTQAQAGKVRHIAVDGADQGWAWRAGHGPITLLLLHGGSDCTHGNFEGFEDGLPLDKYTLYDYGRL